MQAPVMVLSASASPPLQLHGPTGPLHRVLYLTTSALPLAIAFSPL